MGFIEKIFGTHSEHELKRIYPIVDHIEALEPEMKQLSDSELKDKTREFKERLDKGQTLDDILPEACSSKGSSFARAGDAPLSCAADRRNYPSSGTYRRNEDR